jgi:hypothetical protein
VSGQQFLAGVALHLGRGTPTVLACEQAGQTAGFERVHPVEKPAAADTQLFGNLRGGQLAAGGQSCGQQSLLAFDILTRPQLNGHSLRQIRPVQVVSLRHVLLCLHPKNSAISNYNWYYLRI